MIYERDTRNSELRDPDFAMKLFDFYGKDTPFIDEARKARKDAFKKMLQQVQSSWRAETQPIAADGSVDEGTDKAVYTSGDQPGKITGYAQEWQSGGVLVTKRQQNVQQADVASEDSRQIRRDQEGTLLAMERLCLSTQAQSDGTWTNGRTKTGGVFWLLNPNPATGSSIIPANLAIVPESHWN